ncbi:MAG: hypothetical protein RLZZ414_364 [Bacteroidota bacterium]|jgi:hypothetical protein
MIKYLGIIIFVFALSSCEKLFLKDDVASTNPFENFDYLWNEVDKKYAYFELKNVDWAVIGQQYRAKLYADMSRDSLFKVLRDLLFELKDDHVNLVSPFNVSVYNVEFKYPPNYFRRTVSDYYLNQQINYTGAFTHGFLPNKVAGYVRYSSFMNMVNMDDWVKILKMYENTNGLVLDIRENGGGVVLNIPAILSPFVQNDVIAAYTRTKNGPNINDFSAKENFTITPHENYFFPKPVMVLTDRGSYSASTFFATATKALPNVELVGDTTGGGGGLPNGGQLPNGWTYRFSVSQTLYLNGDNSAENGVPPDYPVLFDWTNLQKDEILDKAIEILQNW